MRPLGLGELLDVAPHLAERRILLRAYAGRRRRGLQQLVGRQRHRRCRGRPSATPTATWSLGRRRRGAGPGLGRLGAGLAERRDRLDRLGRRHRLLRGDGTGAEPRRDDGQRRGGRLVGLALEVHVDAGRLGGPQPLLDDRDVGFVAADLPQRAIDVGDAVAGRPEPTRQQRAHGRVPRRPLQGEEAGDSSGAGGPPGHPTSRGESGRDGTVRPGLPRDRHGLLTR